MNEISIKDQLSLYKTALEILKSRDCNRGICTAIEQAHYDLDFNSRCDIEINPEQYTVFFNYHKQYSGFKNVYWFPLSEEGKLKRIQLLELMIKDCENVINKN